MSLLLLIRSRQRKRTITAQPPAMSAAAVRSVGHVEAAAAAPFTAALPRRAGALLSAGIVLAAALPRHAAALLASTLTLTAAVSRASGITLTAGLESFLGGIARLLRRYARPPRDRHRVRPAEHRRAAVPIRHADAEPQAEIRVVTVPAPASRVFIVPPEDRGK